MKDNTFIWCVIIVCLTVLMFTTLSRETLCELRLRGASMEVVASLACKSRESASDAGSNPRDLTGGFMPLRHPFLSRLIIIALIRARFIIPLTRNRNLYYR